MHLSPEVLSSHSEGTSKMEARVQLSDDNHSAINRYLIYRARIGMQDPISSRNVGGAQSDRVLTPDLDGPNITQNTCCIATLALVVMGLDDGRPWMYTSPYAPMWAAPCAYIVLDLGANALFKIVQIHSGTSVSDTLVCDCYLKVL